MILDWYNPIYIKLNSIALTHYVYTIYHAWLRITIQTKEKHNNYIKQISIYNKTKFIFIRWKNICYNIWYKRKLLLTKFYKTLHQTLHQKKHLKNKVENIETNMNNYKLYTYMRILHKYTIYNMRYKSKLKFIYSILYSKNKNILYNTWSKLIRYTQVRTRHVSNFNIAVTFHKYNKSLQPYFIFWYNYIHIKIKNKQYKRYNILYTLFTAWKSYIPICKHNKLLLHYSNIITRKLRYKKLKTILYIWYKYTLKIQAYNAITTHIQTKTNYLRLSRSFHLWCILWKGQNYDRFQSSAVEWENVKMLYELSTREREEVEEKIAMVSSVYMLVYYHLQYYCCMCIINKSMRMSLNIQCTYICLTCVHYHMRVLSSVHHMYIER